MASGSTGTPWNIQYPIGSDQYALTNDLAGMASSVSLALSSVSGSISGVKTTIERGRKLTAADDVDAMRTPNDTGRFYVSSSAEASRVAGDKPFGDFPFSMDVIYINQAAWQIAYPGGNGGQADPVMRKYAPLSPAKGWSEWKPILSGATAGQPDQNAQRDVLVQRSRVRHGGRIGTDGRTVVALSFDHGFTKFRDLILPHLIRLGLPATVAVNTDGLGSGESAGVSYPQLQEWAIQHGIELANHSRSHSDATTDNGITDAILGSLDLLQERCPEVNVDAYIMPGVSGSAYNGFGSGETESLWWTHVAGRTILQNHAVVTAAMLGQAVPCDGVPVQTVDRASLDYASGATAAQNAISSLHGTGLGYHVFMHPNRADTDGFITAARLVEFLEFLAAERDAGRVEVLTVSGAAWADAGSARRADLTTGVSWSGGSTTLTLAPLREWARGSQWCLSADTETGTKLTAADDTGALDTSITATSAGRARLNFTIPATASNITVTVGAGTAPRVEPV